MLPGIAVCSGHLLGKKPYREIRKRHVCIGLRVGPGLERDFRTRVAHAFRRRCSVRS